MGDVKWYPSKIIPFFLSNEGRPYRVREDGKLRKERDKNIGFTINTSTKPQPDQNALKKQDKNISLWNNSLF